MRHLILLIIATAATYAQSEAALRAAFVGKNVRLTVDLPATSDGLDLSSRPNAPIDILQQQRRISDWGVGVARDTEAVISNVRVRKNEIEVWFGAGGLNESSYVYVQTWVPESDYERDIRNQHRDEKDPARKAQLSRELDRIRLANQREERRLKLEQERLQTLKQMELREKAPRYGSRIVVRFPKNQLKNDGIPTPTELADILARCITWIDLTGRPHHETAAPAPLLPGPSDR